jgi:hypothetical protein
MDVVQASKASSHRVGILDQFDERAVTFISNLAEHLGVTVKGLDVIISR